MRMPFRPILVSISSCLLGLGVGIAAQIIHRMIYERDVRRVTEQFESRGWSPPLLVDMLKPSFYPMLFTLLFGLLGIVAYLVYCLSLSGRSDEA